MKTVRVEDVLVPLDEYATVDQESTLVDAILALEEAQKRFQRREYKHRAILVTDQQGHVVGKMSLLDVIRALEPRYGQLGEFDSMAQIGFGKDFIKTMIEQYGLWQKPLEEACERASRLKVKDVMYTPEEQEYVEADASLDEAIHQFVMGHHQSLLVTRGRTVVGVLRLTDVFSTICDAIKARQT